MRREFILEAAKCRAKARQFRGRAEETFLLRVAAEFEDLSGVQVRNIEGAAQGPSA